jgi:flagellar basal body-associated protein FliL
MGSVVRTGIIFVVGVVVGAGALYLGMPAVVHARAVAAAEAKVTPAPFNAADATVVTVGPIESNLASAGHYVSLSLSFQVSTRAFIAAGGSAGGAGSTGTGSPLLDARIDNLVTDILRATSYGALEQSGGVSVLKASISTALQSVFGPGTIGAVYFNSLVTQ